jgi:hypothetical protein
MIPEDPVPGTWYYQVLKKNYEGSTRYQMLPEIFSKFFRSKKKEFGPVQKPQKAFIEFFSYFWSLYRYKM